jgi:uncharacterized oxidoreductase
MPNISSRGLYALSHLIARRMGSEEPEAHEVADHIRRANLAGHDSHGIGMFPAYVRLLKAGLLVPNQTLETVVDFGALLVFDARRGFGQRMAGEAVRLAIRRARETGACVLGLRNSAHIGRVGTYGELAASHGMSFTAYVNVADHVYAQSTYGGRDARLGTNPFVTALPGPEGPVLLDMATTAVAGGKIRVAYNKGQTLPDGVLIDKDGNPTNDPAVFSRDRAGTMLSFGGHKGAGLAIMCELMSTALTGGLRAEQEQRGGIVNNMTAIVVDLGRVNDIDAVRASVASSVAHVKAARPMKGVDAVLVPGDPERRAAAEREAQGVEIDTASWRDIRQAALDAGATEAEIEAAIA